MYRRIVVALDGSALAERVLPHAGALAETFECDLLLVRATPAPETVLISPAAFAAAANVSPERSADPDAVAAEQRRQAMEYLVQVATRLRRPDAAELEARQGPAADVIVQVARERGADLLAMTTHGEGGLKSLVFGSVAREVVRKATCPVLLVPVAEEDRE